MIARLEVALTMKILSLVLLLTSVAVPALAQRQPLGTLIPSRPALPHSSRPATPYGALTRILPFQYALRVSTRENLKANAALRDYAATIAAGKTVAVKVLWEGLHYRTITDNPDGFLLKPTQHQESRLLHGTNVQKARDLGYHCTEHLCVPPEDSRHSRDPAQTMSFVHAAMDAGTVEAWEDVAHRVRSDLGDKIDDLVSREPDRPLRATDAEIHAANMIGYRQAVYLATTFTGFSNTKLSQQIYATGTAPLDVYDALTSFRNLPPGASQNLAAVALSGNLVSAGLLLADAFGGNTPSSQQVIMEEMRKLQHHVQQLRTEMHERFDGVHEHLDAVYGAMVDGFGVLARGNRRAFQSVLARLDDRRRQITELGRVQLDTQAILIQQFALLTDLIVDLELADCLIPPSAANMDARLFRSCRNSIAALHGTLPSRQLPGPQSTVTIDEWLQARPDLTISWEFRNFKRLLSASGPDGHTRSLGLPESVVGPEGWFALMDLHDGFVTAYLQFAVNDVLVTGPTPFSAAMGLWRSDLERYANSIMEELRAFQEDSRPTAISVLLEEAWSEERFAGLLASIGDPIDLLWSCIDVEAAARTACEELGTLRSSTYVRDTLLGMPEFAELERAMSMAGSQLQHWTALAFRGSIGRSDVVTTLAAGWTGLPDIRGVVQNADLAFISWPHVIAEIETGVESVKELLRSDALKGEVAKPLDNDILTGVLFPSLGDVALEEAIHP